MSNSSYIGLYWGARSESAEEIARRLSRFALAIGRVSPMLATWRTKGMSAADGHAVDMTPESLTAFIAKERVAMPGNAGIGDELGFTAGLWNGDTSAPAQLTIRAGSGQATPGMTANSVLLKLDGAAISDSLVDSRDSGTKIFQNAVAAWGPDWASWCTTHIRRVQDPEPGSVVAGWATFLSAHAGSINAVSAEHATVKRTSEGTIVTLPGGPLDMSEADVLAVRAAIRPPTA